MHVMFVWELFWLWIYPSAVCTRWASLCAKCEVLRKFHVVFENDRFENRIFSLSLSLSRRARRTSRFQIEVLFWGGKMLCMDNRDVVRACDACILECIFSSFLVLLLMPVDVVRVFILETHVQHYELKSQMFVIIIISTRESDQISFFAPSFTHTHPFFFRTTFHLPHPFSFLFTSNWWCDI